MPHSVRQVMYVSRAGALTAPGLQQILQISRRNNRRADVTGCLLFTGAHFAQILEGRTPDVEATLQRIQADSRHSGIRILTDRLSGLRSHPEWDMASVLSLDHSDSVEAALNEPVPSAEVIDELLSLFVPDRP